MEYTAENVILNVPLAKGILTDLAVYKYRYISYCTYQSLMIFLFYILLYLCRKYITFVVILQLKKNSDITVSKNSNSEI